MEELKKHLDTVIVVPNQNLFKIASETTTFKNAFTLSNDVLKHGVQSVTDLMVRPGMINLDFADVETVMASMGKAMMGTGEAEGENRSVAATEMAISNPLIDDYTLKGAKGLLVNITGGEDLKLFEVEESVNKIRAEVDPEAELIFGAIEDLNLNGKMRVSIVATSLDGQQPEPKTVLNMVNRIQNRNTGYSEGLFSKNAHIENNTFNSISGATALKLDEEFETSASINNYVAPETQGDQQSIENNDQVTGISIENIPYIENNISTNTETEIQPSLDEKIEEEEEEEEEEQAFAQEYTPPLFADDNDNNEKNLEKEEIEVQGENLFSIFKLFNALFEIPAFLRKQKF